MPTNKIKSLFHHHLDQYLQIVFALVFQTYWGLVLLLIKIVRFKSKMIVINVEDGSLFPWCIVTWFFLLLHDCYYYYNYFHLCVRFKSKFWSLQKLKRRKQAIENVCMNWQFSSILNVPSALCVDVPNGSLL